MTILAAAFAVAVGGSFVYLVRQACARYRLHLDWLVVIFAAHNLVGTGLVLIYWEPWVPVLERITRHWPTVVTIHERYFLNGYLVLYTVSLCWPFCCMQEWTVWTTLILLIIWDLFAVLTPCGPLRWIMNIEHQRIERGLDRFELPPGLIYETKMFRLGTGDILFYGVLVGRAATVGYAVAVMCALAIYMGIVATIWATLRSQRHAIPALPIALVLGIAVYFVATHVTRDYISRVLNARVLV